jgi:choline kinase
MNTVSNVIVLAAGRGDQLDGLNSVMIRHPQTGLRVLDHVISAFEGKRITVVVGYRAIQVMESYPMLNYVINPNWAVSNNAMSLGLALGDEPSYVLSGDMFVEKPLVDELDCSCPDLVLTEKRENRTLSAVHCVVGEDERIVETYQGAVRDVEHPEAIGLFKISDYEILRKWKFTSIKHGNLFVAQTLPCHIQAIKSVPLKNHSFVEINTPEDYLRLIEKSK